MGLVKGDRTPREGVRASVPRGLRRPSSLWLVTVGLVLTAFNLRVAVTGLGPVLPEIRRDLGMNGTVAGLLTSMPALCFAVFGVAAPRLARRHGPAAVTLAGLTATAAGLALRSLTGSTVPFLVTSALALAGTAIGNVLMPVLVKRYYPDRVGAMTGLYSMALTLGGGTGAALTFPLARAAGDSWRAGLGLWAAVAALATLPWLLVLLRPQDPVPADPPPAEPAPAHPTPGGTAYAVSRAPERRETRPPSLARSRVAWALAVFVGVQAISAYTLAGWAPQIFRDAGVPASTAGLLTAVIMGLGAPLGFVLPRLASRMPHQGPLVAVLGAFGLAGYAGLWAVPAQGAWLWVVLLGISNCAFPVALTMIGLRSRTSQGVARLSAFTQSIGYLICIPGPLLVGTIYEATGGWDLPLALLIVLMVAQIAVGWLAGRDRHVEDGG
ncbi:CynX/NimT family MFS transporter [Streptomyces sp. 6N223]|uniref:CynX/NimT family MFS transporter n=1 Tax=Streptomyces sp. 6N223 TaxID=3457412 RepID=UPI003FD0FDC6